VDQEEQDRAVVEQEEQDRAVVDSLIDQHSELSKRWLPMVKKWLDTLTKAGRRTDHQLIRQVLGANFFAVSFKVNIALIHNCTWYLCESFVDMFFPLGDASK